MNEDTDERESGGRWTRREDRGMKTQKGSKQEENDEEAGQGEGGGGRSSISPSRAIQWTTLRPSSPASCPN